jgi:hypothetical protein
LCGKEKRGNAPRKWHNQKWHSYPKRIFGENKKFIAFFLEMGLLKEMNVK